jgi:glycosyltransferase involved in cell wall biosynthesis
MQTSQPSGNPDVHSLDADYANAVPVSRFVPAGCKVLHCAETIKGGIASYLRDLIALQARDFGATRITVVIPASQRSELDVPSGVRLQLFDDANGRLRNALVLARHVRGLLRSTQPRNVHVHSTFAGVMVRLALAPIRHRARVLYCSHGWAWDRSPGPWSRFCVQRVERVLSVLADRVICISDHDYRAALDAGIAAPRLARVLNGVAADDARDTSATRSSVGHSKEMEESRSSMHRDPAPAAPDGFAAPLIPAVDWPAGATRLLFIGRLDRQKGADIFCDALRQLGTQASGVLVGTSVRKDTGTLAVPPNVRNVGWLGKSALRALLAQADVLVVPSRWEGFGLVAVEAMRESKPVIAARVGGLPEIVLDGSTGYLVDPERPAQIAALVNNTAPSKWRRLGAQGRARYLEQFTAERMHRELAALYR